MLLRAVNVFILSNPDQDVLISDNNYLDFGGDSDIALLELEDKLNFTDTFSPICLTSEIDNENDKYFTAGYGANDPSRDVDFSKNTILSEIEMKPVPNKECSEDLHHVKYQMCVRGEDKEGLFKTKHSNLCVADYGAPLMTRKDGRVWAVGVASLGICSDYESRLSGYEKIMVHKKFLEENTKSAFWCEGSSFFDWDPDLLPNKVDAITCFFDIPLKFYRSSKQKCVVGMPCKLPHRYWSLKQISIGQRGSKGTNVEVFIVILIKIEEIYG